MEPALDDLHQALVRDCGLPTTTPASREDLIDQLARRVDALLRNNPEKLSYYLYALDVSEEIVAEAFCTDTGERPARLIAEAILKREAERLHTRQRYEKGNPSIEQ